MRKYLFTKTIEVLNSLSKDSGTLAFELCDLLLLFIHKAQPGESLSLDRCGQKGWGCLSPQLSTKLYHTFPRDTGFSTSHPLQMQVKNV